MDLNAMYQTASHNPVIVFGAGLAFANAKTILHYVVLGVFKVPILRAWLVGHPAEAKADLAVFVAEVDADIDDMTAKAAVAAAPVTVTPSPMATPTPAPTAPPAA